MKKILIVGLNKAPLGGEEIYQNSIQVELTRRGYDARLIYGVEDSSAPSAGDSFSSLRGETQEQSISDLARDVQAYAPDIIYLNHYFDEKVVQVFMRAAPTYFFLHSFWPMACPGDAKFWQKDEVVCQRAVGPYCLVAPYLHRCGSRRPRQILRNYLAAKSALRLASQLSGVVVASDCMKEELVRDGIEESVVHVNPLFVAIDEPQAEASLASTTDVLFAGRLVSFKGARILLEALTHCSHSLSVKIAGDGVEKTTLMEQAGQPDLKHHTIEFLGWQSQRRVQALLQQSRILAMPSLWAEPFGLIGIEAMRAGRPVVAFDVGGIPTWLDSGCGVLVKPYDVQAFAQGMRGLLSNEGRRLQLGEKARQKVRENFTVGNHLQRLLDLWQNPRR